MNVGGQRIRAGTLQTARLKPPSSAVARGVTSLWSGSRLSHVVREKTRGQNKRRLKTEANSLGR